MIFLAVIAAGFLSENYLDRRFAAIETSKSPAASPRLEAPAAKPQSKPAPLAQPESKPEPEAAPELPTVSSGACVDNDGSWKNWPWGNVPMLSPKCAER